MPTEFDSAIRQMQEQDLKSSMYVGARSNPDEEADLQSIADRVGLPVEAVRRNKPEVELHDKLKSFDYEKVIKESPALSAWYADRKNAAVAHDDFDTLSETGKILKAVPTGLKQGWEKQRMMFLNYQEAIGNISPSERSELSELDKRSKSSAGVLAEGVPSYLKAGADVLGMLGRSGIRAIEQGGVPGMVIGASAGGMLGLAGGPGAPATVPAGAAAGGLLGLKTGTAAQFAVNTYESSVGEVYGDLKGYKDAKTGATIDPTVARYAALIAGAPVAGLEFLSLGKAIKAVPGGDKLVGWMTTEKLKQVLVKPTVQQALKDISTRYAVAVGTETFTEGLQKVVSVLAREAAQEADGRKFSAYDQEQFKADVAETGAEMHEAFKASVTLGGAAAGGSAIIERNKIAQAKQNQHFFEALGEKAGESNLRGRLPERYQEVITKLAEDGPVQNVMIPSEKFTEYFQSVGIDPATAAQEAGASNYAEALAVGGDVVIPISGFAATIAPTEHLQGLQQDMRLSAEEMTMREAELAEKNRPETERELQNEIERLNDEAKAANALDTAIQRVITDVEGQLVSRYDLATARTMAASMRGMAVLATRANPDADPLTAARDLWEKYGLNIQANPLPDILTKRPDFDARIDPLLDRLRAGDVPSQSDVFGKSLVEVLRAGGGVSDSGGELAALDVEAWDKTARKGGQKRLVSKGGMSFDSAREYLKERGFDVGETEADVVAAIDREMRGDPVFAVGAGENETMKTADDLAQLDRVLAEMGVDLNAMDNAQVKEMLRKAGDPESGNVLFQTMDEARGSLKIGENRQMKISLLEKANLSTFLHETGHFYLEVLGDLAEAEGTSQQVKDDYAKILKFLGVSSRDQIRVEHHEKFARANEAYLMEGKAPAPELRDVFQKFSAWLKLIYENLRSLDVTLTEEVRGVMDRIYATDEEIKRAKEEAKFVELFIDAKAAKMSEAEFSAYKETVASMTVSAKEELQTKLMRIEKNKRESWWREGVAAIAKEVEAEFDAQPAAQALAKMGDKDSADRINKTQLIDRFGAEITKRLPKKGATAIYAEDGADIDAQAEMMGFESADDMVQALVNLPNRARYIAAESKARMMERHGDLLNSVALADEAMVALHNEEREKVLKIELRALNRLLRDVKPILDQKKAEEREKHRQALAATDVGAVSMYRDIARGQMGQKQVRDIAPNSYLVAGRKANRLAFEAMAKGDYAEAAIQKQREMFNHFMFIEGQKARKEADSIEKYLRGFNKTEARQKLGKAGGDYLAQIDGIMDRYEFRDVTLRKLDRRESLGAWLNKQEAEGATVEVPIELQDESRRLNWRQVPLDELRAVRDSVKNIAHLANLKNKLVRKGKLIEFDGVVKELLGAIESSGMASTGDLERPNLAGASLATKGAAKWRKFDAAHLKTEQIIEWLDGGRINGPWARYFFDLADSAQTKEYDLHAMVTSDIERISSEMPKEWRDSIYDQTRVRIPGFSAPVTRYTLLSIAFNMGNASNMQRLRDGYGLTDADFQAIRDELTETDMRFVQGVWDAIEKLWPEMSALQERTSGLPPEKVEAQPLEVAGKSYRGGYFPLVYDPRFSAAGAKQASEVESVQSFVASGYGRVGTNKGATISRVENLGLKPKLDYQHILSGHMAKVIKDISHRESVIGMQKILMQPDIKNGLIDKLGEDGYKELNRWLQTLVTDRADTLAQATGGAKLLMHLRTNTAIVTMGWKISTMLSQFAGFASALDLVKPQFMTKALIESAKNPRETWAMISEKSGEMRNRSNTIERDVRDALLRMRGDGGMLADVRRTAFFLTAYADRAVSVPTWLGAYNQAKAESLSEEDAIRAGDRAVRLSQGAGGSKDLSAVQRNNELMRLLTMYYTPFSVLYSRLRDVQHAAAIEGIGYVPKAVARLTALVILPAIMGDILAGRGPDDDEDETWWAIRKMLLYPMATIPFVRDLAGYLEAGIIKATGEGEMRFPPSYKLSPVMSAVDKMLKIPGKISDAVEGKKEWDGVLWDVFETSGYALGLPTAQPRITGEYFENVLRGENTDGMTFKDAIFRQQNKGATK